MWYFMKDFHTVWLLVWDKGKTKKKTTHKSLLKSSNNIFFSEWTFHNACVLMWPSDNTIKAEITFN